MFSIDAAHGHVSVDDNGNAAYDALIADPDVDAIYLALPHGMHTRWACRALRAGKAVLCEKPAVLSEEEALSIASTSHERGVLFMEEMCIRDRPTNVAWSLALTTWIKSSVIMDVPMVAMRSMCPPCIVWPTGRV